MISIAEGTDAARGALLFIGVWYLLSSRLVHTRVDDDCVTMVSNAGPLLFPFFYVVRADEAVGGQHGLPETQGH
jgi:hypothetical protein